VSPAAFPVATPIPEAIRVLPDAPNFVHVCLDMDPIKDTGAPFPSRGPHRVCFLIPVESAWQRTLAFAHRPSQRRHHLQALRRRSGRAEHRRLPSSSRHPA
jgi:hypothetical protein